MMAIHAQKLSQLVTIVVSFIYFAADARALETVNLALTGKNFQRPIVS